MKREALSHTKMAKFMRVMKLKRFHVVGLCELLWHTTAREAPAGDIGKLDNEDIAYALDWDGDPEELISGFIQAELVDVDEAHRLVIHDWYDHAEDSVHSKLARARKFFANGQPPKITGLRKDERDVANAFYSACNPVATPVQRVATAINSACNALVEHALPCLSLSPAMPSPAMPPAQTAESDILAKRAIATVRSIQIVPVAGKRLAIDDFRELMESTGKPLNEHDFIAAAMEAASKDMGDAYFRDVVVPYVKENLPKWKGETNKDFVPFPVNLLKKTPWTRAAKARDPTGDDDLFSIPKDRLYDPSKNKARMAQIALEAAEDLAAAQREQRPS